MFPKFCVLLVTAILSSVSAEIFPAFLWGTYTAPKPSLQVVTRQTFYDTLTAHLNDSMIVAFLEPELSNEDLSLCKADSGEPCYTNLMKIEESTYYTNVDDAIEAFRRATRNRDFVIVNRDGKLDFPITYEIGKIVYVKFDENDKYGNLSQQLSTHDKNIAQIYEEVSQMGKIFAIYTGITAYPSKRRFSRAVGDSQPSSKAPGKTFRVDGKFLIYYTELLFQDEDKNKPPVELSVTDVKLHGSNESGFEVEMLAGSESLKYKIMNIGGYWQLDDFEYAGEKFRSDYAIQAAHNFSFYCGKMHFVNSKKASIIWNGLQMQPRFNGAVGDKFPFGDPWHCVGFTSAGIWSGLFVTFMLLGIMSIGLTWIMDINTMDRFDDPKGKTITVNTVD